MQDEELLDSRSRNMTLAVVGAIVLLITGLVANNYRIKAGWVAAMGSEEEGRQGRAATEMMRRGDVAEQLQGEEAAVRAAAVRSLARVGTPQAADNLVPFMKDPDQPVREAAIKALTAMGTGIALKSIIDKAFSDSDDNVKKGGIAVCKEWGGRPESGEPAIVGCATKLVTDYRKPAADAIVEIRNKKGDWQPRIVQVVVPYVDDRNPLDRTKPNLEESQNQAIDVLDRAGDTSAVPALIGELPDPRTRRGAVGSLGRKKDPRATGPLLDWLPKDDTLRQEIVIALGQIGDPRATGPLIEQGLGSVSDSVRAAASDALRSIGSPAVPSLTAVVRGSSRYTPFQRAGAARALGGLRDATATSAALAALTDPEQVVREAAAASLADSGDARVLAPLVACFNDRDESGGVQSAAARSIAAFRERAVPTLVEALGSPDPARAYWANHALLLVGAPAVEPLMQLVRSSDAGAAQRAARLLGDLGDARAVPVLEAARRGAGNADFEFAATTALRRLSEGREGGAEGG